MYLKIKNIDQKIVEQSIIFFGEEFCNHLKQQKLSTFRESLVARYVIKENDDTYHSISHKKDLVFVGTHDQNIGVDIEILKPRDISLQDIFSEDDYGKLGSRHWTNFYVLWTAHESIIKFDQELNYKADMYKLVSVTQKSIEMSDILFSKEMVFECGEKKYKVVSGEQNGYIYSVCLTI